jgi:hypothetical protein
MAGPIWPTRQHALYRPLEQHILQTRFGNGYKHLSKLGSGYAFIIVKGHCQAKRFHCVYMHCVLHTQTSQLTTSSDAAALLIHAGGPGFWQSFSQ